MCFRDLNEENGEKSTAFKLDDPKPIIVLKHVAY
jgi:hypothetical protein